MCCWKGAAGRHKYAPRLYLRLPAFLLISLFVGVELLLYFFVRWVIHAVEWLRTPRAKKRVLTQMGQATNWESWKSCALELDRLEERETWKELEPCGLYEWERIKQYNDRLHADMGRNNSQHLAFLSKVCHKNMGAINEERLYAMTHFGTKNLVREYVDNVCIALQSVGNDLSLTKEEKIRFFRKVERSYGKTALCLSGGGAMGMYHLGLVKSLLDRSLLPDIIAGTSAGAMVASIVCTHHDDELQQFLTPAVHTRINPASEGRWIHYTRFLREGVMFSADVLQDKARAIIGAVTFLEAFRKTGRVLNITVSSTSTQTPLILNYVTAPNVLIYSAVVASSAVPYLVKSVELLEVDEQGRVRPHHPGIRYNDGSMTRDLPMRALGEMFNVNFFIVSQVNPHIVPFFFQSAGSSGEPPKRSIGRGRWRGGWLPALLEFGLKEDMVKWLKILRRMDILPQVGGTDWGQVFLQRFEGSVTIVPTPRISDYWYLLSDPDFARMSSFIQLGQIYTWPKLSIINSAFKIERTIRLCLSQFAVVDPLIHDET